MRSGPFTMPLALWLALATCVGLTGVAPAYGQSAGPPGPIDVPASDLKAPPSPAFVVLGVSPSSVDRPTGVRAVVVSALSALSVGEGFPKNYAFEVAPYWFARHDAKNFNDYYKATFSETIRQQFSLSVATTALEDDSGADLGTGIGIGVRTLLKAGKAHPFLERTRGELDGAYKRYLNATEVTPFIRVMRAAREAARRKLNASNQLQTFKDLAEKLESLEEDIRDIDDQLAKAKEEERPKLEAERQELVKKLPGLQADALAAFIAEQGGVKGDAEIVLLLDTLLTSTEAARAKQAAAAESEIKALSLAIQDFDLQRIGFTAAVAAATSWEIPRNTTEDSRSARSAFWFTPSYRWVACVQAKPACDAAVDITGVLRYLHDARLDDSTVWDTGVRFTWQPRPSLAAAFEWVHRAFSGDIQDSDRAVGVFEYELTKSAFFYATFGRDFSEPAVRRNLASIVGVTFGFGRQPIVRVFEPRAGTS
jgi:hypothetical protein